MLRTINIYGDKRQQEVRDKQLHYQATDEITAEVQDTQSAERHERQRQHLE